jgi:glycosyltransferase involved in cell wall biosynthesis
MRILHSGNLVNVGYYHAKELRKQNISTDLLMNKNPGPTDNPLNYDDELSKYPEWIKFYDLNKHWKFFMMKTMRNKQYDLIHAYVEAPIFAQFSNKPFLAHVLGSDLRELAFTNSLKGFLLRRAYKKARVVLFSNKKDLVSLKKLGLKNNIFFPLTPNEIFYPTKERFSDFQNNFVIFHPSRIDWRDKGNNILIEGFAKFVKNNSNAILVMVKHTKEATKDIIRTEDLIKKLKIENSVKIIDGPLNAVNLAKYYNSSDVIADQFTLGENGVICLEAMACKKPVLIKIEKTDNDGIESQLPIVNVSNPDEINESLENLKDEKIRNEIASKSYEWIKNNRNKDKLIQKLIIIYKKILNNESLEEFTVS